MISIDRYWVVDRFISFSREPIQCSPYVSHSCTHIARLADPDKWWETLLTAINSARAYRRANRSLNPIISSDIGFPKFRFTYDNDVTPASSECAMHYTLLATVVRTHNSSLTLFKKQRRTINYADPTARSCGHDRLSQNKLPLLYTPRSLTAIARLSLSKMAKAAPFILKSFSPTVRAHSTWKTCAAGDGWEEVQLPGCFAATP